MLSDRAGLMRKMWAAAPFQQRQPGTPACWEVRRDVGEVRRDAVTGKVLRDATRTTRQSASTYFAETLAGEHCVSNWYEGNPGQLGERDEAPSFSTAAPALLGFDETIDEYCSMQPKTNDAANSVGGHWHARNCIAANLNILSLYGERVPYNICRNLEWMVCAAGGKLPGQLTPQIVFSWAPRRLDPGPESAKPFGQCRGWRDKEGSCEGGYATDDIYFLESCLFNQLCDNRDELWRLDAGEPWECRLNGTRFDELREMLVAAPDWGEPRGLYPPCAEWCNEWTCHAKECTGCGTPEMAHMGVDC